jgi:hypothetical protein
VVDFWQVVIGGAGLGAILSLVLWALYRQWVRLPPFERLSRHSQLVLFRVFLMLTIVCTLAGLGMYAFRAREEPPAPALRQYNEHARALQALEQVASYKDDQGQRVMNRDSFTNALDRLSGWDLGEGPNRSVKHLGELAKKAPDFTGKVPQHETDPRAQQRPGGDKGKHYDFVVTPELGDEFDSLKKALREKSNVSIPPNESQEPTAPKSSPEGQPQEPPPSKSPPEGQPPASRPGG